MRVLRIVFTMYYHLFPILAILSLGHLQVLSKSVLEDESGIFSVNFDVIRPWNNNCEDSLEANHTLCGDDLFNPEDVVLQNIINFRYIMKLKIGSDQKEFKVKIDTGSNLLWVFGEGRSISKTYVYVNDKFKIQYGVGSVEGDTVKDTVHLTTKIAVKQQMFGAVNKISKSMPEIDGVLGLNMRKENDVLPPFLHAVKEKAIKEPIFGIYVSGGGSAVNGGVITFGGINKAYIKPNSGVTSKVLPGGFFAIQMKKMMFGNTEVCKQGGTACRAIIDSGCSTMTGPKAIVDKFNKDVLKISDKREVKCEERDKFPDIKFTIEGKTYVLKGKEYTFEFKNKCYTGLFGLDFTDSEWLLGDIFLIKQYTEYNLDEKKPTLTIYDLK